MDIRQMNKTNLEHWRGLRKQLWPGHPDDAHLADGEEILQADHLASFIAMADGVAIGFADASRLCHKNSGSRMGLCQGHFRNLYRLCGGTEGKLTNA